MVTTDHEYYLCLTKRSALQHAARRLFVRDLCRHFTGRVLDIGCGIGEFLRAYQGAVGLDRNQYVVAHCVSRGLPALTADAGSLPFAAGSFHGALLSNVLEHFVAPEVIVREAVRVVEPSGRIVVTVPMEAGFAKDPTHVHMLTEPELRALGDSAGLSVASMYGYPVRWPLAGKVLYFTELRCVFEKRSGNASEQVSQTP